MPKPRAGAVGLGLSGPWYQILAGIDDEECAYVAAEAAFFSLNAGL